jgi:hypothetical protein
MAHSLSLVEAHDSKGRSDYALIETTPLQMDNQNIKSLQGFLIFKINKNGNI